MVKPNFLCIGVQKGGTTSLIKYMNLHPDIYMHKYEIHFFDKPKNYILKPEDYKNYENKFNTSKKMVGEKTPTYNYLRFSIDRIYSYNPDMKLVLILREPISRALSQYNYTLINKTLLDVSDEEIESFFNKQMLVKLKNLTHNIPFGNNVARGYYDEIITYILSKFKRENLLILISEEILENRNREYQKIFKFLGVKPYKIDVNLDNNIGVYKRDFCSSLKKKLYDKYKVHNQNLYKILNRKIDLWEKYYTENNLN